MNTAGSPSPWGARFGWGIALLFIILGLGYSTLTPVFEHSDETLHYPYVKHLADGRGLPLAVPGRLWHQEGTQPPLYYAIVAATTFWIDTGNLPDLLQPNRHWLFTEVRSLINDNQNVVLHGPMDAFPYRRAALAVHMGRWWSLAFGLLAVVCTYLLARRLFPHNLPLAVTATTLTALTPQFIRVSATVSNDSLSAALTTLTILLAFKFTDPPHQLSPSLWRPLLLGALSGLALLTKLSSLSTLFLVAFIIFWRAYLLGEVHQAPLQKMVRWLVVIGAVTALLTGWWFWRNYQLYGEWLANNTHLNLAGRNYLAPAAVWSLRAEAVRAYWATFGWGQIRPPEWVYRALFWLGRVGLAGLALAMAARLVQGAKTRPLPLNLSLVNFENIIILLVWAALNLALYFRWVMDVGSVSHTRLVFPAIAAISLLLALGWHALLPRGLAPVFSALVIAGFLALNLYSLGRLIYPAFRIDEPANRQALQAGPVSEVELTFLNSLKLARGRVYPADRPGPAPKYSTGGAYGNVMMVAAQWQVLSTPDKNYSLAVVLQAPDGSVLARRETYPGLGLRPTRYLTPGQTFTDLYPLKLARDVPEPVVARATINLFDLDSGNRAGFPALDSAGQAVTPFVGRVKIVPQNWPQYRPAHTTRAVFNNAINLVGYDLPTAPNSAGPPALTLYWESLAPVDQDYVVFLHLLDANGQIVAQADAPPTGNAYPTSWWAPGEVVADRHPLPDAAATRIRLGLYDLNSGLRLAVTNSSLPGRDNGVEIELR